MYVLLSNNVVGPYLLACILLAVLFLRFFVVHNSTSSCFGRWFIVSFYSRLSSSVHFHLGDLVEEIDHLIQIVRLDLMPTLGFIIADLVENFVKCGKL